MNLAYLSRRSTKKLQEIRKWGCFITNIKEFTQRTQNVRFHRNAFGKRFAKS